MAGMLRFPDVFSCLCAIGYAERTGFWGRIVALQFHAVAARINIVRMTSSIRGPGRYSEECPPQLDAHSCPEEPDEYPTRTPWGASRGLIHPMVLSFD